MIILLIEAFFTIAVSANALLFIPQIIRLYKQGSAQDVSLLTFGGFNLINLCVLLHAIVRHDHLLMYGASFSLITNTTITVQIIYYRFF